MELNETSQSLIYLDYNATTPLADEVVKGIQDSLITDWGNPSSGNPYGAAAKAVISRARNQIAEMLNCSPDDITFTSGGTEANNMVIYHAVRYFDEYKSINNKSDEKPHIITSSVEHDSVILPIKHLEELGLVTSSVVEVKNKGCINVKDILAEITDQTCLITIMYANNETGVIMPISEIGRQIAEINSMRERKNLIKIQFHTDAAQIIGKEKVSFMESNVDFMTVVGHKFYAPRIGCICARTNIFPMLFGGGQERGIRPGTENTPMIVGLGVAAELVTNNIQEYRDHMFKCREKLEALLKEAFGSLVVVNCSESVRLPNTLNISFKGPGLEGLLVLSRCCNLLASVGAACHGGQCSQVLINSGVSPELGKNAIRLSVGRGTTFEDLQGAVTDLMLAVEKLQAAPNSYFTNE